ncbi:LPXTG cell wall anchor domain-containing protein [Enterococcus faecalis]|jgi:LPXTG-motif cell wall-anchored protein|uniref:LPXTG cell wall anchor domain-containing protein n=1 Tax=Enterococcus faecalis TaxID=1351 RepID=UPI000330F77B|nr:LPXTG cell wall anchor domain-containing protein [Enterococcus faecalis]EGO2729909.1 LPXTG cell wall anchor domain-containing protein [Enterococcus faecalis]EGO7663488.1 LPXTG cell wall anchor domain-containing protein [Enterococcus faecalis]EGO7935869.1 LPXTG cell wall anchor domain-containing protein [Enterococcus faecalis]EGO8965737.1 LPXTG cell wall anchor domain-containing protein [Enterococcus faecalis]EGO9408738.1 LPXTG cell wall anchor domain-containing protein [Enterococcus faecali
MKKLAILLFILSSFLIKDEGYSANVQQKSSAESQVTITFVESSSEHEQVIRKDFYNIDPSRSSKTFLPSTGSKMSGALFILGILAFFLSVTILSLRRENRRNKL